MGLKYLLDTNTIIYYLADYLPETGTKWLKNILANQEHCISVISRIELLSKDDSEEETLRQQNFIAGSVMLNLEEEVVLQTIALRRKSQVKKLPDAVIAATALYYDLTLVTRNTHDFKNIPGLTVVNPHEI